MGPYVIYERLGAGGMATVHRAEQIGLAGFRKQVALKRLLPHIAGDPKMLKMFTHEARLASHLRHGNVAQIYDLGKHEETYFIAMEYVAGPTLTQIMKQCGTDGRGMPVAIVLSILAQICDALDHAHNLCDDSGRPLGIIHRDVSPGNIIVSSTGVVKLIDFGIAKVADAGEVQTQAGYIKGKYAYIAPEYTLGHLDLRADLFGLGVIAHELLASRRLFNAPTDFETIQRLREMPIQAPSRWNPQVPRDVDDIVMTALQRDPTLRWQSAAAMRTAIHNAARTTENIVTSSQLADWVERSFAKTSARKLASGIESPDSTSGSSELTTNQKIELEALGAIVDASQATIPDDDEDFDTIEPSTQRSPERVSASRRAPTRSLGPQASEFATEAPTTVATAAYSEAVARATPVPRTSVHVIRRDTETGEIKPDPKPAPPPIKPYKHGPPKRESSPSPSSPPRKRESSPRPSEPPPPTSLPLGAPAHILPTLHDLVLIPEPAPDNKAIAISLPPEQAEEAARAADEAERAAVAAATFPASEDSGVVVSAATKSQSAAVVKRRRVWPWILLALVVLAMAAAWYLYFIEGLVPDLDL
jgi:serine/threonine protein kinase